jgi:hypothetical protein
VPDWLMLPEPATTLPPVGNSADQAELIKPTLAANTVGAKQYGPELRGKALQRPGVLLRPVAISLATCHKLLELFHTTRYARFIDVFLRQGNNATPSVTAFF